jgi:hypothetical protein
MIIIIKRGEEAKRLLASWLEAQDHLSASGKSLEEIRAVRAASSCHQHIILINNIIIIIITTVVFLI